MEEDIKLKGGKGSKFSGSDTSYSYVVSPKENAKGKITLTIAGNTFNDIAGNENPKKYTAKQTYDTKKDTTPPTLKIFSSSKGVTNKDVTFDFIFFEVEKDLQLKTKFREAVSQIQRIWR